MRIVKNPDERKQEILDGAIRVFARKGYERTSISDIAKEIGVSQGLCYRYFPSKEDIYDAAIDEYAEYIMNQNLANHIMRKANMKGKTLKEQIQMMSAKMGDYVAVEKGQSELYELFHKQGNRKLHDQLFLRVAGKYLPLVTKMLDEACQRGEIKISNPETTAYFLIYGQMGILMDNDIPVEDKMPRIQACLIELLGL